MSKFLKDGDIEGHLQDAKNRTSDRLNATNCPPTQFAYERILQDIADMRMAKVIGYGEAAYEQTIHEDLPERFLDIKRKFNRLKQLTDAVAGGDETKIPSLVDCYRDIANYGIMGVQVLEKHFGEQPLDYT